MVSRKSKNGNRKKTVPLIGGIIAAVGSAFYALRRRRNGKAAE